MLEKYLKLLEKIWKEGSTIVQIPLVEVTLENIYVDRKYLGYNTLYNKSDNLYLKIPTNSRKAYFYKLNIKSQLEYDELCELIVKFMYVRKIYKAAGIYLEK